MHPVRVAPAAGTGAVRCVLERTMTRSETAVPPAEKTDVDPEARRRLCSQGELTTKLADISGTTAEGGSDSGLVTVRAQSAGTIVGVEVDPRAMRIFSEDPAAEFQQAATRAQETVAAATKEEIRTLLEPLPARDGTRQADGY